MAKQEALPVKRSKVDWAAIERDFRTGKFTFNELEVKHHVFGSSISRKSKKDGWVKDLSDAIRQATSAKLAVALVNDIVNAGSQDVQNTISAAAEVNTRIILGHRSRLTSLADAVDQAQAKLLSLGHTVTDIREAAVFVQAVGNLSTATKNLIEQERKAFGLDEATTEQPADAMANFLTDLAVRGSRLPILTLA